MSDREKTIVELTKHYLRYLKLERGYSPNTVEAYKHDLEWLLGYLEQEGVDPLSVKLEDLEHFAAMLSRSWHQRKVAGAYPQRCALVLSLLGLGRLSRR